MESSSATPPPEIMFSIVSQDHQQTFDAHGDPAYSWHITFKTRSGVQASVDVPDSDYNAENVARIINEKAAQIDEVQSLGAGGQ